MSKAFEYHHVIGFEETNLVGNVYFANHVRWQGACREHFLRAHAPGILDALHNGLALVTTNVACEYLDELVAFDAVTLRMRLAGLAQNRVTMAFEYWRQDEDGERLVARGRQQIACMERRDGSLVPVPVPAELRAALQPFANGSA